jgi:hypothetical protein
MAHPQIISRSQDKHQHEDLSASRQAHPKNPLNHPRGRYAHEGRYKRPIIIRVPNFDSFCAPSGDVSCRLYTCSSKLSQWVAVKLNRNTVCKLALAQEVHAEGIGPSVDGSSIGSRAYRRRAGVLRSMWLLPTGAATIKDALRGSSDLPEGRGSASVSP